MHPATLNCYRDHVSSQWWLEDYFGILESFLHSFHAENAHKGIDRINRQSRTIDSRLILSAALPCRIPYPACGISEKIFAFLGFCYTRFRPKTHIEGRAKQHPNPPAAGRREQL